MGGPSELLNALDAAVHCAASAAPSASALHEALGRAREVALAREESLIAAQEELARLTNRYVALQRLFEDLELEKICDAISDVVVNIVGSEDFVVYLCDDTGDLYPVRGMGPSDAAAGGLGPEDPLRIAAAAGSLLFDREDHVALAPLQDAKGRTCGLVALKALLRHKPLLTEDDRGVLEDLRHQAGRAVGYMLQRQGARG